MTTLYVSLSIVSKSVTFMFIFNPSLLNKMIKIEYESICIFNIKKRL